MTPDEEKEAMRVYLPLMDEVVARINVFNVCSINKAKFAPGLVRELCYLQFRAICEIVAVGCLAIYGERKIPSRLRSEYAAPKLIKALGELAPGCYPFPMSIEGDAKQMTFTSRAEIDHLTRDDLITLWNKSGDILHRAPYSKIARPSDPALLDLRDIPFWAHKIVRLLNVHGILLSPTKLMTVVLHNRETGMPSAEFVTISDDGSASSSMHHYRRPR